MIQAKIIADSISEDGIRLTTLQIKVHRYVWSEFMTHRAFSRNAMSSRAIPVHKMLKQVWSNPAIPVKWGSNKAGMQAGDELIGLRLKLARIAWKTAAKCACVFAWAMMQIGLHKQWANRVLEPWQWMNAIVSSTEWDNFFSLRIHPDAQPDIRRVAECMKQVIDQSEPKLLSKHQWHLPYIDTHMPLEDLLKYGCKDLKKASAARCARVSYLKHDNTKPSIQDDLALCDKLMRSRPIHASPFEHQATPIKGRHGNFNGWKQQRQFIEENNDN